MNKCQMEFSIDKLEARRLRKKALSINMRNDMLFRYAFSHYPLGKRPWKDGRQFYKKQLDVL